MAVLPWYTGSGGSGPVIGCSSISSKVTVIGFIIWKYARILLPAALALLTFALDQAINAHLARFAKEYAAYMSNSTTTSHAPRLPLASELDDLATELCSQGLDQETADEWTHCAFVAVHDHYIPGSPGYVGKLMTVVWEGGPDFFDVYIWVDGKMHRCERN
jgi:hypothetical protein